VRLCDLTLPSPEANLALDEALLDQCEEQDSEEVLRFWIPQQYFVVLGYANKVSSEVNLDYCRQNSIPILRRPTGGGTVLQGPGCLNYALILRISLDGPTQSIPGTNNYVLHHMETSLSEHLRSSVKMQGQTDLAIEGRKICGNAQRRRKNFLIFHGSFLLDLDFGLVERVLPFPSKQPDYRANRSHSEFLTNLLVKPELVMRALSQAWKTSAPLTDIPLGRVAPLVREKYSQDSWNFKF
jgi:lipoate-protein ligase A